METSLETRHNIIIQQVDTQQVLPVRQQVLWPDKPMSFCLVDGDEIASHYGAFVADQLVCVASIYINGNQARLRKFATVEQYQGQGIGTKVIQHVLDSLRNRDVDYFWCDARTTAIGFYHRFGLRSEGDEFHKSNVGYFKMSLSLT